MMAGFWGIKGAGGGLYAAPKMADRAWLKVVDGSFPAIDADGDAADEDEAADTGGAIAAGATAAGVTGRAEPVGKPRPTAAGGSRRVAPVVAFGTAAAPPCVTG